MPAIWKEKQNKAKIHAIIEWFGDFVMGRTLQRRIRKPMIKPDKYDAWYKRPFGAYADRLEKRLVFQFLGDVNNRKILDVGCGTGNYCIPLAKKGAEVTGICSTTNLELVKSLGADKVVDYTKEDFSKIGEIYDIIFDAVFKISKLKCKNILKDNGTFDSSHSKIPEPKTNDLIFIKELIEKNKLKPVIDKTYPMEQIVEAHRYVDKGHKKGNVVIKV